MPTFERGDIVAVPFPYVDLPVVESRPALVVSGPLGPAESIVWVLMITSARDDRWPGDVLIETSSELSGLRIQSMVRAAKIATIETRAARLVGRVDARDLQAVEAALQHGLRLTRP